MMTFLSRVLRESLSDGTSSPHKSLGAWVGIREVIQADIAETDKKHITRRLCLSKFPCFASDRLLLPW